MKRKKLLIYIVVALSLSGLVIIATPFLYSLKPSASATNNLPRINLKHFEPGTYRYVEPGLSAGWKWLLINDIDKGLFVYNVPIHKGRFILPDINWYRHGGTCLDFRPETVNNRLKQNGLIRCHDKTDNELHKTEWTWSYEGKNLGTYTDDMISPRYTIENEHLIIGKYQ